MPKPKMDWPLPKAFDPAGESVPLLVREKTKLSKNFRWSRAQNLFDAVRLATLLHVSGRDDDAQEVCAAIGQIPFDGTFTLWSAVEQALVLQARWLRQRGDKAGAAECVRRVREAGFVQRRLEGRLLDPNDTVKESGKGGDTKSELAGRLRMMAELAFIIELGGSEKCPVDRMEQEWDENFVRLLVLVSSPKARL